MTYNAANRKDVRRLEKQAHIDEQGRLDTVRMLMSTTSGRHWVFNQLEQCHIFASSFSLNASEAAFHEGERNVGLRILNDVMQACPDEYVQMMREENVRHIAADAASERSDGEDGDWGTEDPDAA